MLKSTVTVLAAATMLVPVATAEGLKATLKHDYDIAALSDDAAATKLLSDLRRAAARACTSRVPAYGGQFTDPVCTASLYEAAVRQIHEKGLATGVDFAPSFERAALTRIASID